MKYNVKFRIRTNSLGGISQTSMRDAYLFLIDKPHGSVTLRDCDGDRFHFDFDSDNMEERLICNEKDSKTHYIVPFKEGTKEKNFRMIKYFCVYH